MKRKIIFVFLAFFLCTCLILPFGVNAAEPLVYDDADLLTVSEEADLGLRLQEVSQEYQAQIVVCTIPYFQGADLDAYVEYVYDAMEFGYGPDRDGVLLLVCMNPRQYRILSNGYAGVAINPSDIGNIGDVIVPDLSSGDYADAFQGFADECAYYLDGYINGYPYEAGLWLVVSLAVGVVVALISLLVMWCKLKSVHRQNRAGSYIKPGSMRLTLQQDIYLYRNVTRTKRETSNSSHSGGTARSKGGGSF